MKQFFLITLSLFTYTIIISQTNDQAKQYLKENKLAEAKTTIDNFLAIEANKKNADAHYTKAKIYNSISQDATLNQRFPNARMDAFNALKRYTELDDRMLISLQIDGYKPINDIYTGFYQEGANNFNAKNYEKALSGFTNAITVSSFMTEKGWISLKLDTNSVLYAGVAAEKLSRTDDAVFYYSKLVTAKVTGDGFVEIYKWVANSYYEKKNYTEAEQMIKLGKEMYPSDPFWSSLELDMVRETLSKEQLFSKYEEVIASNPANHLYRYNYAVELYQVGYNTDPAKRPANSKELIKKAGESIKKAIQIKPDYARAQLFAGQIVYNKGVDILKTNKTEALSSFNEAMPYFLQVEKLYASKSKLTLEEKQDLKEAYDLLITIFDQKAEKEKVKEYEVKFNEVDKKL